MKKNNRIIITAIIISVFFGIDSTMSETYIYASMKPFATNTINLILIVSVAVIGYLGIRPFNLWLRKVWLTAYLVTILSLSILVFINKYMSLNSINLHFFTNDLKCLFLSPLPFGVIILIARTESANKHP